jgi:hypothetical protein
LAGGAARNRTTCTRLLLYSSLWRRTACNRTACCGLRGNGGLCGCTTRYSTTAASLADDVKQRLGDGSRSACYTPTRTGLYFNRYLAG